MSGGEREAEPDRLHERLLAYEGMTASSARGRDPVNEPMIRHWCEAMGHPVPADGSAPATMLQVWTMAGLGGAKPAASGSAEGEPGERARDTARTPAYAALLDLLEGAGFTSIVATDCEQEYLRPLRPGDEITYDAVIESVSPRKATKLGTGYFITTRMDIRVPEGRAGTHRFRVFKFRPTSAGSVSAGSAGSTRPASAGSPEGRQKAAQGERAKPAAKQEVTGGGAPPRGSVRPRPVVNRDNAGFWEGVARHQLLYQCCDSCGTNRFPWLPGCNACGSLEWSPVEASGSGTVYSYVVMHHPPFPAFDPPYAVALVELAEGVRIVSNITGVPSDKVRIGMPVELEFLRVDDELELPVFRGTV